MGKSRYERYLWGRSRRTYVAFRGDSSYGRNLEPGNPYQTSRQHTKPDSTMQDKMQLHLLLLTILCRAALRPRSIG